MFKLIGNWLRAFKNIRWFSSLTREEAADILDRFLQTGKEDDRFLTFLESPVNDPLVGQVQGELNFIERDYPARDGMREFCNPEGLERVRELVQKLRSLGPD